MSDLKKLQEMFLLKCKENFYKKVTPSNEDQKASGDYQDLVSIAKLLFKNEDLQSYCGFFQEGQYFVALWAAHLLIEYNENASAVFKQEAYKVIEQYTDNPLAPEVAEEERKWLSRNPTV